MNLYRVEIDAWYSLPGEDDFSVEHQLNVLANSTEEAIEKSKKFPLASVPIDDEFTYETKVKRAKAKKAKLHRTELVAISKELEIDIE
jgi:hypothetical protein